MGLFTVTADIPVDDFAFATEDLSFGAEHTSFDSPELLPCAAKLVLANGRRWCAW